MILSDIKAYVKERGRASLRDVAARFDVSEDAARGMLEHWERKGVLRREKRAECSRACVSCALKCGAVYVFVKD